MSRETPSVLPVRLVLWAVLVGSVFVYGVLAFLFGGREPTAGDFHLPAWIFPAAAFVSALTGLMMHRQGAVMTRPKTPGLRPMDLPVWAMDEAVAAFGLAAVFMGGTFATFTAYGVAALILLVLHRPQS